LQASKVFAFETKKGIIALNNEMKQEGDNAGLKLFNCQSKSNRGILDD
jgi:hypothetical protein